MVHLWVISIFPSAILSISWFINAPVLSIYATNLIRVAWIVSTQHPLYFQFNDRMSRISSRDTSIHHSGGFFFASTSFLKASIFFEMLGTLKKGRENKHKANSMTTRSTRRFITKFNLNIRSNIKINV